MSAPPLVVLAAGMSSRYGRLKQVDPLGPNGECSSVGPRSRRKSEPMWTRSWADGSR